MCSKNLCLCPLDNFDKMPPKRASKKKVGTNLRGGASKTASSETPVVEQVTKGRRKINKNAAPEEIGENASHASSEPEVPIEKKRRGRPARTSKNSDKDISQNGKEVSPKKVQSTRGSKRKSRPSKNQDTEVPEEPPKKKTKTRGGDSSVEGEDSLWQNAKTIYEFKANDINGKEVSLQKYKGHVCIVVNVASRCGHTKSNYEQFVQLFDKYSKEKGLRILGKCLKIFITVAVLFEQYNNLRKLTFLKPLSAIILTDDRSP